MKYINQSTQEQLDREIEAMFDLSLPNSAFKRVIPASVKAELRSQYMEYLEQSQKSAEQTDSSTNSRQVSSRVIRVNISSLRDAGYCCCPQELAAACESLIKSQATEEASENLEDKNVLTEQIPTVGKNISSETAEPETEFNSDTTDLKSEDGSSSTSIAEKSVKAKAYPKKEANEEFGKSKSKRVASHQKSTSKRKYFTKYMSDEFNKDTKPVDMSMMDGKTQDLFKTQDFNELVSDITGIF